VIAIEDNEYSDPDLEESEAKSGRSGLPEFDKKNLTRLKQVPHYAEQICQVEQIEELAMILPGDALLTMQCGTGITHRNRSTVVNWLIRLFYEWQLTGHTLFNAIHCFDIVLTRVPIPKTELQLLGAVCLWMCAKLNEFQYPSITDFRTQCRLSYKRSQFLEWEKFVFNTLHFTMEYPTAQTFLARFLGTISANPDLEVLATFACEVSLLCFEMNQFKRSVIAFASILLAGAMLGELERVPVRTLLRYSHFTELGGVLKCVPPLLQLVNTALETKNSPTYMRFIAGNAYQGRLAWSPAILQKIESLAETI
jgi:hypothetical protein